MTFRPHRRPVVVVIIAALLAIAAALAVRRLHVDTSLASLFDADDPSAAALQRVMERFSAVEELLLLVQSRDNEPPQPEKLIAYAQRIEQAITDDPHASSLAAGVSYRADEQIRRFIEREIVPN